MVVGLVACGGAPLPGEPGDATRPAQAPEETGAPEVEALHTSQQPHGETRWARAASGPDEDRGLSVAHDSQGDVYSLGRYYGTVDFGTGPMGPGGGTFLTALAKYRPDGTLVWARVFPQVSSLRVAVNRENDVLLAGAVFEGGELLGKPLPPGGFIAKLSPAGTLRWVRSLPLPVNALAVDRRGNIGVSGDLFKPVDLGGGLLTDVGHPFIAKYSSRGDFRWSTVDPVPDLALDLAADVDGNFYLGGRALGPVGIEPYVRKLCANGDLEWNRLLEVSGSVFSVAVRDNHVILGGPFGGTLPFAGGSISSTEGFGFVLAFSRGGKERWGRALGATGPLVELDSRGGVFVTGRYRPGDDLGRGPEAGEPGSGNMYVVRLLDEKHGRTDWVRTIPSGGLTPADISVSDRGAPAVVGSFGAPVDFGTGELVPVDDDVFTVQFER